MTDLIRQATPADIPALGRIFRAVFGHERPDEVWRWKFFDHPIGAWSWVFEADGEIVAHCGATAVEVRSEGKKILALQLVDFMSKPRHPGGIGAGGVFARTTATMFREVLATTDVKLLYGFPGERHRLAGERLLGYTTAGPIGQLRLPAVADDLESRPLEEGDLKKFATIPSKIHAVRDRKYLRWRYLRRPEAPYGIVETPGRRFRAPRASAIVRDGGEQITLMEMGGSFRSEDLAELADGLSRLGKDVIGWCTPDHEITGRLCEAGFELEVRDHFLAAAWFLDDPDPAKRRFFTKEPPSGHDFYVSLGDYDVH